MVTQELIEYIKSQLQSGQAKEAIKSSLTKENWEDSDIKSAFQTITSNSESEIVPNTVLSNNTTTKAFLLKLVIILVICLFLVGVGIFVFNSFSKNKSSSKEKLSSNSATSFSSSSPSVSPTSSQKSSEENLSYSNSEQGYGFQYLKSWKIDSQGSLTVLVNSTNPDYEQCEASLEKILACNVAISTIPYTEEISTAPGVTVSTSSAINNHEEQIKELATQLAPGNSITPTVLANLTGYEVSLTTSEGSTYNVLLQGSKNMILVQFPNKKTRQDLDNNELMLLNSIIEQ